MRPRTVAMRGSAARCGAYGTEMPARKPSAEVVSATIMSPIRVLNLGERDLDPNHSGQWRCSPLNKDQGAQRKLIVNKWLREVTPGEGRLVERNGGRERR